MVTGRSRPPRRAPSPSLPYQEREPDRAARRGKTSPEELLAAAHGGCFATSLAGELTGLGHAAGAARGELPDRHGRGRRAGAPDRRLAALGASRVVPGADAARFADGVRLADEGCPFSALLKRAGAEVEHRGRAVGESVAGSGGASGGRGRPRRWPHGPVPGPARRTAVWRWGGGACAPASPPRGR